MQRFVQKPRAEGHSFAGIIKRERNAATHQRNGADAIPQTRNVEQWCDVAHAVRSSHYELRGGAGESEFRSRHFARAKLILKTIDQDVAQAAVLIAQGEVKKSQPFAARRITFGPSQSERHLRVDGGCEPLAAIKPPPVGILSRNSFRRSNI